MGQTGEGRGKRRITAPCGSGAADEVGCPATGAVARAAQPRSRGVWLSGAGVDDGPCRPGHQARVWGQLSSRPLQSPAASHQLPCAEARAASQQARAYKATDVVRFLRLLLRQISGKLLVIWDGASIHRAKEVKDFLKRGAAKRLHLERLPGYAPELNPQEGVWNLLKRRELKNLCAADFEQLGTELLRAKERLRHRKTVLCQCIAHAGFPL